MESASVFLAVKWVLPAEVSFSIRIKSLLFFKQFIRKDIILLVKDCNSDDNDTKIDCDDVAHKLINLIKQLGELRFNYLECKSVYISIIYFLFAIGYQRVAQRYFAEEFVEVTVGGKMDKV